MSKKNAYTRLPLDQQIRFLEWNQDIFRIILGAEHCPSVGAFNKILRRMNLGWSSEIMLLAKFAWQEYWKNNPDVFQEALSPRNPVMPDAGVHRILRMLNGGYSEGESAWWLSGVGKNPHEQKWWLFSGEMINGRSFSGAVIRYTTYLSQRPDDHLYFSTDFTGEYEDRHNNHQVAYQMLEFYKDFQVRKDWSVRNYNVDMHPPRRKLHTCVDIPREDSEQHEATKTEVLEVQPIEWIRHYLLNFGLPVKTLTLTEVSDA